MFQKNTNQDRFRSQTNLSSTDEHHHATMLIKCLTMQNSYPEVVPFSVDQIKSMCTDELENLYKSAKEQIEFKATEMNVKMAELILKISQNPPGPGTGCIIL